MVSALVSLSSFKGTLSNTEACEIVTAAFQESGVKVESFPVGDGGAGTMAAVQSARGGEIERLVAEDPLGGMVSARVLRLPDGIYLESAEVCGLNLIAKEKRDPMRASSYGLGLLLREVFRRRTERVYVGLGDSGVSDAGLGMLKALGFRFTDRTGAPVWANAEGMRQVHGWHPPVETPWKSTRLTILCDVVNPVCGPLGAARVYSPQKGASPEQVTLIERGMETICEALKRESGHCYRHEPMGGAAGGLGLAFRAFLQAELRHGAHFLLDWLGFDERLKPHTHLVVGEGCTDAQTLQGKAVAECAAHARQLGKKVAILSGAVGVGHEPLTKQSHVVSVQAAGLEPTPARALFSAAKSLASTL